MFADGEQTSIIESLKDTPFGIDHFFGCVEGILLYFWLSVWCRYWRIETITGVSPAIWKGSVIIDIVFGLVILYVVFRFRSDLKFFFNYGGRKRTMYVIGSKCFIKLCKSSAQKIYHKYILYDNRRKNFKMF